MFKKIALLIIIILLFSGCNIDLQQGFSVDKVKGDLTNAVSDKVSESVQQGVTTGLETAKEEIKSELTAKEIKISSDKIDPETITILKDEEVKLKITSTDGKTHGFYLPGYDITETVKSGETQTVTFKADKTGTFEYSCNLNCQTGIKGSLIVK